MRGKHQLVAATLLGFCLLPLVSCALAGGGSALQAYAPAAAQPPGTARVWFMHTNDPQEQARDPVIYANGNPVGRSSPGIAFYHDFPPGLMPSPCRATPSQRAPRMWSSWHPAHRPISKPVERELADGFCRGCYLLRANVATRVGVSLSEMLTDKGPPRAL